MPQYWLSLSHEPDVVLPNHLQMKSLLYAEGDPSICPSTPPADRSGGGKTGTNNFEGDALGLPWGFSNAPGWSVWMQDEICR